MRFPPQFLDELRARLPVSEVVGKRVKLKKAGREWRGLSPFNQEKSPSFFVNDQKGFFHDFSSGKHGDIFGFVMETDGLAFPEAVERLAQMAGLPMPQMSREAEVQEEKRRSLHDVMELAAKFFESALASRAGAKARGYLADRGLEAATQLRFRIGYAPAERFALKEHLGQQGVSVDEMVEAGMLVAGDEIPVPYDRFRDRVIFPIADLRGRIIAFGGRALEKDVPAKYLNSPETPLFHKGGTLYNIATARAAAHKGAPLIAVEGYVDVIAMVTAGFEATVAPLGTALTEDQLTLCWKMGDEPILCFDGDKAGRRAAYRALDLALPRLAPGKSLRFALLPEGQDPDDLARSGGRQAIEEVLAAAQPLAQMLWTRETEAGGFDTPERRAALEARVGEVTAAIQDETVRRYYRQDFGGRLRAMFSPQQANPQRREWTERRPGGSGGWTPGGAGGKGGGRFGAPKTPPGYLQTGVKYIANSPELAAGPLHGGHRSMIPRREALILQTVLNHPWLLHDHMEELAEFEFRQPEAQRLKSALIDICAHGDGDRAEVAEALNARGLGDLVAKVERAITTHSVFGAGAEAGAEDVLLTWKQLIALHRQRHSLIKELKDAEMATAQDESEESFNWLRDVKARLAEIDGIEALVDGFGVASGRPSRGG